MACWPKHKQQGKRGSRDPECCGWWDVACAQVDRMRWGCMNLLDTMSDGDHVMKGSSFYRSAFNSINWSIFIVSWCRLHCICIRYSRNWNTFTAVHFICMRYSRNWSILLPHDVDYLLLHYLFKRLEHFYRGRIVIMFCYIARLRNWNIFTEAGWWLCFVTSLV